MANAVDARNSRSTDLAKQTFKWTDLKIVHEFSDTHPSLPGHAVAYIDHPDDLAALGKTMGHCAGTHFIWACEEKTWYFFTIISPNGQPHVTLHAKWKKWIGKKHPRDLAPRPYEVRGGRGRGRITCPDCRGYGGFGKSGNPYYYGDRGVDRCKTCKGKGTVAPKVEEGKEVPVPYPKASSGAYPSFADVCKSFESVGRKYEAGQWAPLEFGSTTYDIPRTYKEPINNFDYTYRRAVIEQKPPGVSDAEWIAYEKAVAAIKAGYDKHQGAIQIVGRSFKFDSKELMVVSFSAKGDSAASTPKYRAGFHEFFIECGKKKATKEVEVA